MGEPEEKSANEANKSEAEASVAKFKATEQSRLEKHQAPKPITPILPFDVKSGDQQRGADQKSKAKAEEPKAHPFFEPAAFNPEDLTRVPGAVGQFIDWVDRSAIYPSRRLALGTALATIGTLISHRVMGPTGSATHLYIVELAPTGEGKAAPMTAAKVAFESIGAGDRIGPGDFRSSVGFINTLKRQPVFLSLLDEYGDFLGRIAHPSAGNYEIDTMNVMKQVFALSYSAYHSPVAAHEKSVRIFAPSPSIVGFSTLNICFHSNPVGRLITAG